MPGTLPQSSLMARKFQDDNISGPESTEGLGNSPNSTQEVPYPTEIFERKYCFCYGTLMDSKKLVRILGSRHPPPIMHRAKVIGYDIKLWGSYPALVHGWPLRPVSGMAFEILSKTQLDLLQCYETEQYIPEPCVIEILNQEDEVERTVKGVTFLWNGELKELREGKFDLKEWKKEKRLREIDQIQD